VVWLLTRVRIYMVVGQGLQLHFSSTMTITTSGGVQSEAGIGEAGFQSPPQIWGGAIGGTPCDHFWTMSVHVCDSWRSRR
jgi:hypothetical protein